MKKYIPTRVALAGMTLCLVLFVVSTIILFTSIQGEWTWLVFLLASLLIGLGVSYFSPTSKRNGGFFVIACGIFTLLLLSALDMQDEAINTYPGGFEAGNGLLLDGLAQLAYVPAIPLLFSVGFIFLSLNIRRKQNASATSKRDKGKVR